MKKAYVHIGVEKTGTTTIQAFMAKNRDELRKRGVLYPSAPGRENHVGLSIFAAEHPKDLQGLLGFVGLAPDADLSAYNKTMLHNLEKEVTQSQCSTIVLSNEHLSTRIRSAKSITALRDALLKIVQGVNIIVYVRRQDEAVLSEYSTRVKAGYTEPFALQPYQLKHYDYADLLTRWSSVFGVENIHIRIFESEAFQGTDLITGFLDVIRLEDDAALNRVPPQNRSLDAICLEYLRRLNKHLPAVIDGVPSKERGTIYHELTEISLGDRPRISGPEAIDILQHFEASNRDVAIRFLHRPDGRLFANSPDPEAKNNLGVLDEALAFEVTAALWRRLRGFR